MNNDFQAIADELAIKNMISILREFELHKHYNEYEKAEIISAIKNHTLSKARQLNQQLNENYNQSR